MQFANGIDDTDFENLIAKSLQGKVCNRQGGQLATWSGAKTSTYVKHELLEVFAPVSATCMALIRPHTEEPHDATVEHNAIRSQPSNPPLHEAGPWAKLCKSPKPEPVPCPERMLVCFTSRKCRSVTKLIFRVPTLPYSSHYYKNRSVQITFIRVKLLLSWMTRTVSKLQFGM